MVIRFDKLIRYLLYFVILMMPATGVYETSFFTITIILIELIYCFIMITYKKVANSKMIGFTSWMLFISIMMMGVTTLSQVTINRTLSLIISGILLALLTKEEDLSNFVTLYEKMVIVILAFFYFQIMFYYVLKVPIMFQIPFFPLMTKYRATYRYLSLARSYGMLFPRFPGPFSEPAIYAAYVIPYLVMCINKLPDRKELIKVLLLSFSILLSTSGTGIVMMLVEIAVYFILKDEKAKGKYMSIALSIFAVLFMMIMLYYVNPTVKNMIDTLFVSRGDAIESKADYRIYRGISYFSSLPFGYKLLGIGAYNAEQFSIIKKIHTKYDIAKVYYEYFNGISQLFIYFGLVGAILFGTFLYSVWNKCTQKLDKLLFLSYLMLISATSYFIEGIGLIYMCVLLAQIVMKKREA